jgi:NAD(P)H-dependent flavin oxidoreductase YrpB (nitropropane dioxygenase family)
MAGVQGSALAIAVSNAGALGSLPCATLSAEAMRKELTTIAAQTNRPYNVQLLLPFTTSDECRARDTMAQSAIAVLRRVEHRSIQRCVRRRACAF